MVGAGTLAGYHFLGLKAFLKNLCRWQIFR